MSGNLATARSNSAILSTNKLIRNTYTLLSILYKAKKLGEYPREKKLKCGTFILERFLI